MFEGWRFHAFFTSTDPSLWTRSRPMRPTAMRLIEQVHFDLKNSWLAHLSVRVCTASAAWLVLAVIAVDDNRVQT